MAFGGGVAFAVSPAAATPGSAGGSDRPNHQTAIPPNNKTGRRMANFFTRIDRSICYLGRADRTSLLHSGLVVPRTTGVIGSVEVKEHRLPSSPPADRE